MADLAQNLTEQEWYKALVKECQSIRIKGELNARWVIIESYHTIGMRILAETDNFNRLKIYGQKIAQRVAESLGRSQRTIEQAIQFAKKYPVLEKLPLGKNASWHKICNELLPAPKENTVTIPLPEGEFDVLLADPPWRYPNSELETNRSIENHYPTLPLEEITAIKIPAADNSILFLWATVPLIQDGFAVMEAWGFTYKSMAVWDKEIIGLGRLFRNQHEILLAGIKGDLPAPDPSNVPSSVIRSRRTKHSAKPAVVYEMIERMYPKGKFLELFARKKHSDKWTAWGNQV